MGPLYGKFPILFPFLWGGGGPSTTWDHLHPHTGPENPYDSRDSGLGVLWVRVGM